MTHPAVVPGVLTLAAAAAMLGAWGLLVSAGPHPHAATPGVFLAAVTMWQAMVVAMMTPTVAPWMAAYARLVATPGDRHPWRAVGAFAAGYLVVWLGYSIAAAAGQVGLIASGYLHGDRLGPALGGGVLMAAGVFQFLPLKGTCLTHCRNPLTYFIARWKDGPLGGFRLGAAHGAYCLGCCWAVMLTGFAVGLMNLAWMAALTVVVAIEQGAPGGVWVGRVFGGGLIAWGVWLLMPVAAALAPR